MPYRITHRSRVCFPVVVVLLLIALLMPDLSTRAVFNSTPDGNTHPNVGITYTESTSPNGPLAGGLPDIVAVDFCNGILIAPRLVLVAGKDGDEGCFSDSYDAYGYVSFAADYDPPLQSNGQPYAPGTFPSAYPNGKPCREPCYRGSLVKGEGGLGVLVLEQAVTGITPAALPAPQSLGALRKGQLLTTVGYADAGGECGPDACVYPHVRRSGAIRITGIQRNLLKVKAVDGAYPCYDAGGGNFLGSGAEEQRATVVAITHQYLGCKAETQLLRLDRGAPRRLLCSAQFASELGASPLCGETPPKNKNKHKHKNRKHR